MDGFTTDFSTDHGFNAIRVKKNCNRNKLLICQEQDTNTEMITLMIMDIRL